MVSVTAQIGHMPGQKGKQEFLGHETKNTDIQLDL